MPRSFEAAAKLPRSTTRTKVRRSLTSDIADSNSSILFRQCRLYDRTCRLPWNSLVCTVAEPTAGKTERNETMKALFPMFAVALLAAASPAQAQSPDARIDGLVRSGAVRVAVFPPQYRKDPVSYAVQGWPV